MKKIFPILLVLSLTISTQAQMVITSADMPVAGTYITEATDTFPSASLPVFTIGADVNWDFTALNNHNTYAYLFVDPGTTPYFSSFPSATHCFVTPDSMFGYIRLTSTNIEILGMRLMMDTIEILMKYNPTDSAMEFPYTIGTAFTSNPNGAVKMFYGDSVNFGMGNMYIDSIRMTQTYHKDIVVDGWGHLITPLGTYEALRSTNHQITTQEIAVQYMTMWIPVQTTSDTSLVLEWSMKNTGVPLLSIEALASDSSFSEVRWLTVPPSMSLTENENVHTMEVFPNPAKDFATIEFRGETPEYVVVTDGAGREVTRIIVAGRGSIAIDVTGFSSGFYTVNAFSKGNRAATRTLIVD